MKFLKNCRVAALLVFGLLLTLLGGCDPELTPAQKLQIYNNLADPPLAWGQKPQAFGHLDYQSLGIASNDVAPWEDASRIDPSSKSFEWWYYDAHFEDGTSLVVVFYSKLMFAPQWPFLPIVKITITKPDGTEITRTYQGAAADAVFSTTKPYVKIGGNVMECNDDLRTYTIKAAIDDVAVDLTMVRDVPTWRNNTGHWYFGNTSERFAWIPAVPSAVTTGTITYEGVEHSFGLSGSELGAGSGYHDHNYGNGRMYDIMKYWYWARAQVGPYTVIACNLRLKNEYGNNKWEPIFVILDANNTYIDADSAGVTMKQTGETDATLKAGDVVTFTATKDNGDYAEITFTAETSLTNKDLTQQMIFAGMMSIAQFTTFKSTYDASGLVAALPLLTYEQQVALFMLWGDDNKGQLGMDPTYVRYRSHPTLTLSINGESFSGAGIGTIELMDLE